MTTHFDNQDTIVMSWEGGDHDGMQVAVVVTSMAAMIAAETFDRRSISGKPIRGKDVAALAEVFVEHVDRWNIRLPTGRPVPVKVRPFLRLHRDTVMAVLRQWVAYVRVPPVAAEQVEPETVAAETVGELGIEAYIETRTLTAPGPDEYEVQSGPVPDLVSVG